MYSWYSRRDSDAYFHFTLLVMLVSIRFTSVPILERRDLSCSRHRTSMRSTPPRSISRPRSPSGPYSLGGISGDTSPTRFPSGSLKCAKVTMPGMTVTGVAVSPPSSPALSNDAWMSSTWT